MCFVDEFLDWQKVGTQFKTSAALTDKLKKQRLVWSGSAGEAACQGRERVGVSKIACVCFRIQHAVPRGSADPNAPCGASTAAPPNL